MARHNNLNVGNHEGKERPRASVGALRGIFPYLKPYSVAIAGALIALTIAASAVLVMGVGLRSLIDHGFSQIDQTKK